jgi:outer membrane protein assembly factor BamD (BamD/ComL family)
LLVAAPAAASLSTVRSQGGQIGAELAALRSAGKLDAAAERRLIDALGALSLEYIDESDAIQRRGGGDSDKALKSAFEAVQFPLNGIYQTRDGRMEKLSRAVMDEDGDLEALYETTEYRESQAVAARALYFLNWLNYYGARLFEGTRRRDLLEAGERGFSEFAVGEPTSQLAAESLLGRGLCNLELDKFEWAERDFGLVLESQASPERKAKARIALLDSYARAGKTGKTVAYADELLRGGQVPDADKSLIRFYKLRALLDAATSAKGQRAEEYRRDAGVVMSQLRRAGKGWESRVDALLFSSIEDPADWVDKADTSSAQWELAKLMLAKEDCDGAAGLLEKILTSDSEDAGQFQTEARYWRGVCRFKAQEYRESADDLDAVLAADADAKFAAEARYLRFKSLEALMAEAADTELTERYVAALRELLARHPDHQHVIEARYRLGEYLQATGSFAEAIAEYEQVSGDEGYALRARFGILQSRFEILRAGVAPDAREKLIVEIGRELDLYDQQAARLAAADPPTEVPLQEFGAKVVLLRAVYLSLSGREGEVAPLLAGFGDTYPEAADLQPQAVRMRLMSLQRTGEFAAARDAVTANREVLAEEGQAEALRALAAGFSKAGRDSSEPKSAAAAADVAALLFEIAAADGQTANRQQRISMAHLYEKAGEFDRAAAAYDEILAANPDSLDAIRGLARVAEARGDLVAAGRHWTSYTDKVHAGDAGWFRGQYEQARLTAAAGDAEGACTRLKAMRQAMPGLRDEDLRQQLTMLYEETCG